MDFKHSVANLFVIPFAIFEGHYTWIDLLSNVLPVYAGNILGGAILVSLFTTEHILFLITKKQLKLFFDFVTIIVKKLDKGKGKNK